MIETLQQLCILLSSASLTVQDVSASLGTISQDQGGSLAIEVHPSNPAFRKALIVRQLDTQEPSHIELKLAESSTLTVEDLSRVFGHYQELPALHWDRPQEIAFQGSSSNTPYTCAVLAEVIPGEQGVIDGTATTVTLRRDIQLN
jgi:hypothetical protein